MKATVPSTAYTPTTLHATGLVGSADKIVDAIGQYGEIGASRVYLQTLDLSDIDHLEEIASTVLPQVK